MNVGQFLRQLKKLATDRIWGGTGSGGETVFSGVVVTDELTDEAHAELGAPLLMLRALGERSDDEQPGLVVAQVEAVLLVMVEGDRLGDQAFTGGIRPEGATTSEGRGLHEVEAELRAVVQEVGGSSGVTILGVQESAAEGKLLDGVSVATRRYVLRAKLTTAEEFPAAEWLKASASGGGAVALTWRGPSGRFDFLRYDVRRASGSTPPPTVSDGASAYSGTGSSTTNTPGAGTWSYSIFVRFDDAADTPATALRTSSAVSATVVAT